MNAERFSPLGYVSCCGESAVFHCCCLGKPAAALQYFFAGKATETEYSLAPVSFCFTKTSLFVSHKRNGN